jgi:hypothetical protein
MALRNVVFDPGDRYVIHVIPRHYRWLALAVLFPWLTLLNISCSATADRPYPWYQNLEIVSATATTAIPQAKTSGDLAAQGSASGAAGSLGAGLIASLICGPWYFECAAQMVPGMVAEGAAVGTIDGLAGLSPDESAQVDAYLMSLPVRRNLNSELVSSLQALLPPERLAAGGADARLTLGISRISIIQDLGGTFYLRLELAAQLAPTRGGKPQETTARQFACDTEDQAVAKWLADNGRALDQAINACVESLAGQVYTSLEAGKVANRPPTSVSTSQHAGAFVPVTSSSGPA